MSDMTVKRAFKNEMRKKLIKLFKELNRTVISKNRILVLNLTTSERVERDFAWMFSLLKQSRLFTPWLF